MLTVSDSLSLTPEEIEVIRMIVGAYGFSSFNLIMFHEDKGQCKYEVHTELNQENALDNLRVVLQAMILDLPDIDNSVKCDC